MPATLDIVGKNYYMVIIPLNDTLYFVPCNLATGTPISDDAVVEIEDFCITNRSQDKILNAGELSIKQYLNCKTGKNVLVENLIDKMFQQATMDQQAQHNNNLIQLYMDRVIQEVIVRCGLHRDVNEEALKSWIYIFVSPPKWGKRVSNDAFFALFAESKLITRSSALMLATFEPLVSMYLQQETTQKNNPLLNSQNLLCELSVDETREASLSMNMFSITKPKNPYHNGGRMNVDPFLSKPTLFSNNQIQMNVGYGGLAALFRDAVREKIGLTALFCNELLNHLCSFLSKLGQGYQEQGTTMLDRMHPFQRYDFPLAVASQDIAALRLITLQDIYAVLSPQLKPIIVEIQVAIERELLISNVFFAVIPEVPSLYPQHIEDILFICIMLLKIKLESNSKKRFKYIYDKYKRSFGVGMVSRDSIAKHIKDIVEGVQFEMKEKALTIYKEFPPLSNLVLHTKKDTRMISTINYIYLSSSQVLTQSVNIHENGAIRKVSSQKSEVITLDQFLTVNDSESRLDETALQFHFSESVLFLLESMFPKVLHEFATLYRRPFLDEDVASTSYFDLEKWFKRLYRKCEQILCPEVDEHGPSYTEIMFDLASRQSDTGSPRIYMTQPRYIGAFLMVYFGYLKETLANNFGQDSESTRYIFIFEHLMRNATIGQVDDILMRKALGQCGWVPETKKDKRKLMVYDIEDSFPVPKCLQKENIRKIPAKEHFAVVTMTRYYIKTCLYQALEDILPTDKYYKAIKLSNCTYHIDFYDMICERIWRHVIENVYETGTLLECPSDVDIMDIDFTLEAYKSFKKAFLKYMLNTFPFTYGSQPDEKHRFSLQTNGSIVLTNRLVLHSGVLPALKMFMGLTRKASQNIAFLFYGPSNFDDQENLSLPMLELIETELKKLLETRFRKLIWASEKQFGFVHCHRYLNPAIGDTAFGYEALKTGVIRCMRTDTFAISFQYTTDDEASFVEVITGRPGPSQLIRGGKACVIDKAGSPYDNSNTNVCESDLVFKIPDLTSVSRIRLLKIHDNRQRKIGDVITIQKYRHAMVVDVETKVVFRGNDYGKFRSHPFVHLCFTYYLSGHDNAITLYSNALNRLLLRMMIIHPLELACFDSYEVGS